MPERYRFTEIATPGEARGVSAWCTCPCSCAALRDVAIPFAGDRMPEGQRKVIQFATPQQLKDWRSGV